jgi:hypothetical protein
MGRMYHVRHCAGMRAILLVVVCGLLGCKGKNANQTSGSGAVGSGSAVATAGSDSGSAGSAGSATGAGSAEGSAAGSGTGSGSAAAATGPTLSAKGGLSTLGKIKEADETATAKEIEKKLGLPGVTVSFDVMDVAGEVEREEGYWSVKRGEKELVQALRTMSGPDEAGPLAVVVWTEEIPTADSIKVGDTFATLIAKHPDVKCKADGIADTVYADIVCTDAKEKELGYLISPDKAKIKKGKVAPDTAKIIAIGHEF